MLDSPHTRLRSGSAWADGDICMRAPKSTPPRTLVLPSVLDLAAAETLHRRLLEHGAQAGGVVLDGSTVERVSTACLQLLAAAARAAPLTLAAAAPALRAALDDLGLAALMPEREAQCPSA